MRAEVRLSRAAAGQRPGVTPWDQNNTFTHTFLVPKYYISPGQRIQQTHAHTSSHYSAQSVLDWSVLKFPQPVARDCSSHEREEETYWQRARVKKNTNRLLNQLCYEPNHAMKHRRLAFTIDSNTAISFIDWDFLMLRKIGLYGHSALLHNHQNLLRLSTVSD